MEQVAAGAVSYRPFHSVFPFRVKERKFDVIAAGNVVFVALGVGLVNVFKLERRAETIKCNHLFVASHLIAITYWESKSRVRLRTSESQSYTLFWVAIQQIWYSSRSQFIGSPLSSRLKSPVRH